MDANCEIELKLELTKEVHSAILQMAGPVQKTAIQENNFFDTPEGTLNQRKWAARIRFQNEKAIMTVKGPGEVTGGVQIRPEYETVLTQEAGRRILEQGLLLKDSPFEPAKKLFGKFGELELKPFLSFTNTRRYIPWRGWIMELDETRVGDNFFYELEVETGRENIDNLKQEIKKLFLDNHWPVIYSKKNKLVRAMQISSCSEK